MADHMSFMAYLCFPDPFPESSVICLFKNAWQIQGENYPGQSFKNQLDAMGLQIRRGTIKMSHSLRQIPDHQSFLII
jgi:hypothetical protein